MKQMEQESRGVVETVYRPTSREHSEETGIGLGGLRVWGVSNPLESD